MVSRGSSSCGLLLYIVPTTYLYLRYIRRHSSVALDDSVYGVYDPVQGPEVCLNDPGEPDRGAGPAGYLDGASVENLPVFMWKA